METRQEAQLYASFAPDVRAYARRRIDAAAVDDVVADVFVAAWRKIELVPEEPLPWLLGVARKVIGNHVRSARRRLALTQRLSNEQPKLFMEGAPAGMDPGLIPDQARVVTTMLVDGVKRDLWVAPD